MKKQTAIAYGLMGMGYISIILAVILNDSTIDALFAGIGLILLISSAILAFTNKSKPDYIAKKESI